MHKVILTTSTTTFLNPASLCLILNFICSRIRSALSSLYLKTRLFLFFQMWYMYAFHPTFNSFEIKAFPFNLCTAQVNSTFQPSTSLERPHSKIIFFQISFDKEHVKNRWSLDSCSCLQREQRPSMSTPQNSKSIYCSKSIQNCQPCSNRMFWNNKSVQINLCHAIFSFFGLISLQTSVALYLLLENFHCSLPSFHSMNLFASVLYFNNFLQHQLLLCVFIIFHKLLPFKTFQNF